VSEAPREFRCAPAHSVCVLEDRVGRDRRMNTRQSCVVWRPSQPSMASRRALHTLLKNCAIPASSPAPAALRAGPDVHAPPGPLRASERLAAATWTRHTSSSARRAAIPRSKPCLHRSVRRWSRSFNHARNAHEMSTQAWRHSSAMSRRSIPRAIAPPSAVAQAWPRCWRSALRGDLGPGSADFRS